MKLFTFLIAFLLIAPPVYSQSRMTDSELDGLTGPVKLVKLEWKEITTYPGQDVRPGLIFISEDHYAKNGQVIEKLGQNDYRCVYSIIDGFKTGKLIESTSAKARMGVLVGNANETPIEGPDHPTAPDPRFSFKLIYEYDELGRVKTERLFENDGRLQTLQSFKYDAKGRVSEEKRKYTSSAQTTTYKYDDRGFLVEELLISNFIGSASESKTKTTYSEYEADSHGNWISRRAEDFYFDNGSPNGKTASAKYDLIHIEHRTISYYK